MVNMVHCLKNAYAVSAAQDNIYQCHNMEHDINDDTSQRSNKTSPLNANVRG